MRGLIANPIRVYLVMTVLALLGVLASTRLPVSLFPNSLQPQLEIGIPYGSFSSEEFRRLYGTRLEGEIEAITGPNLRIEKLEVTYGTSRFYAMLTFNWGADSEAALRETQQTVLSISSTLPEESRRDVYVGPSNDGSFMAMSFYSKKRSLTELHGLLEPILLPPLRKVRDANQVFLWNPGDREIKVELKPDVIAAIGLPTRVIETTIQTALQSQRAGTLENSGHSLPVSLKKGVQTLEDLRHIMISLPAGRHLPLGDIADVRYEANSQSGQRFKTSGVPSLILFASPKQGGNVKQMAEQILAIVDTSRGKFPADVEYTVLVDPSFYIRAAIHSVTFEVVVGSLLASLVLFLFIGSFRNVITTAIEIPISIAMAFIMMWLFDININLLSLAGLALAAGMNVDASVVVMENIFRHFEEAKGEMNEKRKMDIILEAVDEVKLPVIASTLASLVVFLPFMFISGLSYAVLGDLAKAVIFSHGFSAIVALILVPTVRFHLLRRETKFQMGKAPIDFALLRLERVYLGALEWFLDRPKAIGLAVGCLLLLLIGSCWFILPRLPKEIIGKPETDWLAIKVETTSNTQIKQMETIVQEMDRAVASELQGKVLYTFDQINGANHATILARIADKAEMKAIQKQMEERFGNKGSTRIRIDQWNPSEFRIPDPPQVRVAVAGGNPEQRAIVARDIRHIIEAQKVFFQVWTSPDTRETASLELIPKREQWNLLAQNGFAWTPESITDALRVATQGKWIGQMVVENSSSNTPIVMKYPEGSLSSEEELGSFPLKVKGDLIPLRALADIKRRDSQDSFFVIGGRELAVVLARGPKDAVTAAKLSETHTQIAEWIARDLPKLGFPTVTVQTEDPQKDLTDSMNHLAIAFVCSLALIFLTMILQFGSIVEALLVMAAVPLGLIGALASLWTFQSSLSVNAALGIIMLNGIAVNNSIILVDFARRLADAGSGPREACLAAARQRLRPILITSLTTILGMFPIALGLGTGGRVLQPLGIAVAGGLGVSMLLTLLIVPLFQCLYLQWHGARTRRLALPTHAIGSES